LDLGELKLGGQPVTTASFTDVITEESELREIFGWPTELALNKQISLLDQHCRDIIAKSPFILLGTSDPSGRCDVSPKGDYPGFVRVLDDKTVAIPDLPGNNRLDTLTNIIRNPQVGLIFMIPGMNETLRINGRVRLVRDPDLLESMSYQNKLPKLAIVVDIQEVFTHCPKAFIRSKLWSEEYRIDRSELPSFAVILRDHVGIVDCDVEQFQLEIDHISETTLH
jgi:PPOX class probable FMN-dependent enzyme